LWEYGFYIIKKGAYIVNTHLSKLSMAFLGFVAGVAFLISCGGSDSVSDADAAVPDANGLSVYVNDIRRGAIIDWNTQSGFITASGIRIWLDSGYVTFISTAGDGLRRINLAYESTNCTGQPYFVRVEGINPILARQGLVIANDTPAPDTLYFAQAGTPIESITVNSVDDGVSCNPAPSTPGYGVQVTVNDVTLTGAIHSDFVGEVKLGF
jgi:hypothetical protein